MRLARIGWSFSNTLSYLALMKTHSFAFLATSVVVSSKLNTFASPLFTYVLILELPSVWSQFFFVLSLSRYWKTYNVKDMSNMYIQSRSCSWVPVLCAIPYTEFLAGYNIILYFQQVPIFGTQHLLHHRISHVIWHQLHHSCVISTLTLPVTFHHLLPQYHQ